MGCVYHPDRPKAAACSECRAELCNTCATRLENGRTLCHRCNVALSLQEVKTETAERKLDREARRLGLHRGWRPSYIQVLLTVAVVLAVVLLGLQLYWHHPVSRPKISLDQNNPIQLLNDIRFALEQYVAAHDGTYPDTLYLLLPDFIADTRENRRIIRYLEYQLPEGDGYLLEIKERSPLPGKELVATRNGIQFPGIKLPEQGI